MSLKRLKEEFMDIERLFSDAGQKQKTGKKQQRIISLVSYLNTKPLIYGMETDKVNHPFILQKDVPSVCASRLKEGEVDLGIVPSIEYAHSKGSWRIIPDIAIGSRGTVKSVNLFFKKDLKDIRTVALDTSSRTSVTLLKILFREKYELLPEYTVMAPDLKEMLNVTDAALIIGDKALHYQIDNPYHLDLGEEWYSLTGLPFVYALWAGHELALSRDDVKAIQESRRLGLENIEEISRNYADQTSYDWKLYYDYLTENVRYELGDEEKEGLNEFYRYAFYFGLIDFIPELHFYDR